MGAPPPFLSARAQLPEAGLEPKLIACHHAVTCANQACHSYPVLACFPLRLLEGTPHIVIVLAGSLGRQALDVSTIAPVQGLDWLHSSAHLAPTLATFSKPPAEQLLKCARRPWLAPGDSRRIFVVA